ncbi:PepSY domain-containing protein [Polycladomyces sp. WAk]|uniref:PepSY domain-containing protein n=2 Tax=Polycladomyces zharkentensis TaxID=2807616 RepID=A0ABS2WJT4_9BACL|nr:PepSY domain-containing protein [Polycladomyces sp. WAk]
MENIPHTEKQWYAAIWRWHFYAGIIFAPFIILLAITGSIYLFKPQIESMLYKDLYYIPASKQKQISPSEQIDQVKKRYPDAKITRFTPSFQSNRTSEVGILRSGEMTTVFVNPYNGKIVGDLNDDKRLMNIIKNLHNGELWGGTFGNRMIELTACWAFILILTGMYLWWPRGRRFGQGTLFPRLRNGKRTLWRDLHAVPAFWLSGLILVLIFTGLPWSGVWGDMINRVATATHTGYPAFAFSFGPKPESTLPKKTKDVAPDVPWAAENLPVPTSSSQGRPLSLEKVIQIAESRNIHSGFTIYFPEGPKGVYTISNKPQRPEDQATLHLDQYSGKVLYDLRFNDYGPLAKAISIGIALHEGRYFGWINQLLGLITCVGLIGIAVMGLILWWKRRPQGKLGAPPRLHSFHLAKGLAVIVIALGLFFPLVGISLLLVWLLDRWIIQRIPFIQQWVG